MSIDAVLGEKGETRATRCEPDSAHSVSSDSDRATLLGLYHGYDQARLALARLVTRFGTGATRDEDTARRIWARAERAGLRPEIFDPPSDHTAACDGLNRGAHAAALSAFAAISEKAEELLRTLRVRWPELCEDLGGPLPVPQLLGDLDS
jgi:hypothetical protein